MRIRNRSSRDTETVRRLVRFACRELDPSVRRQLYVEVKDTRWASWSGHAGDIRWHSFSTAERRAMPAGCRYRILVCVGADRHFPALATGRRGLQHDVRCWREALVYIGAHEAKHVERFADGRYRNGAAGEAACDAFMVWMLEQARSAGAV